MPIFNNALAGAAGQTGGAATPTDYQINRSLRFDRTAQSYLNRTPASAGNRKTFTFSCWYKKSGVNSSNRYILFNSYTSGSVYFSLEFETEKLKVFDGGAISGGLATNAVFRDPSAWYHIVCAVDTTDGTPANRVKLYVNGVQQTFTGTQPSQNSDLGINTTTSMVVGAIDASGIYHNLDGYLADVHFIDGQSLAATDFGQTDSDNNWNPKEFSGTYGTNGFKLNFSDNSTNKALGYDQSEATPDPNPDGGMAVVTYTGTASQQSITGVGFQPDLVWLRRRDSAGNHNIQDSIRGASKYLQSDYNGAEMTSGARLASFDSDGFTLTSDNGGNTSGGSYVSWCWKAGGAASLNENGSLDSQVSVSTDYGFSVVTYTGNGSTGTVGHGLSSTPKWIVVKNRSAAASWFVYHVGLSSGKGLNLNNTEAEFTPGQAGVTAVSDSTFSLGSQRGETNASSQNYVAYCWSEVSGFSKFGSYTGNGSSTGPTVTTGFKARYVLIKRTDSAGNWGIYDTERGGFTDNNKTLLADTSGSESTDNNKISITSTGFSPASGYANVNANGGTYIYAAFAHRPGSNFDVNNLVATAGTDGAEGMDVVTYTGNGSTQVISGLKFQPDFVWLKSRNSSSYSHNIYDSVRGATKIIYSDSTAVEGTDANGLTNFNSNGFSLGNTAATNNNNTTYVGWCWKAGGTAASNTDGSITTSVSASTKYGFSIVTYTGNSVNNSTIGHGLNSAPKLIITKNRSAAYNWITYSEALAATKVLALDATNAAFTPSGGYYSNVGSSTYQVVQGSANLTNLNNSGDNYVAYCWSEVPGFSKIDNYTGSGGTKTITTGFKPAFLLIKSHDTASNWHLLDSERGSSWLEANGSASENSNSNIVVTYTDSGFTVNGSNVNNSGTNYIYMAFADTPDSSGVDSLIDTPTNADADSGNNIGNYCTLNPLAKGSATSLSNGNLNYVGGAANQTLGTIGMSSGKWYWEDHKISGTYGATGIALADAPLNNHPGQGNSWAYNKNGNKWHNGSQSSYGATWDSGDTIGIAFDADAGTLVFYKNGVSQGTAFTGLTNGPYFVTGADNSVTGYFNFGATGSFKYAPPAGYKALCTQNLTDPTIADGSDYFETKLYDGNGTTQTISGFSFSPDWVWIKNVGATGNNTLWDIVRDANKRLMSDSTAAESTRTGGLTTFTSDGFTHGDDGTGNTNNNTYVAWAWDAGTTTDTNNTDGTITPTGVRANASAGFSIAKATISSSGTIGHGLNAKPHMVFRKRMDGTSDWYVAVDTGSVEGYLLLNSAAAITSQSQNFTTTTFDAAWLGNSGEEWINYAFAPVAGYSAFGTYTGNGNANGPFVYTGFRPAFILIKGSSFTSNWFIQDNERDGYNVNDGVALRPNLANAEDGTTTYNLDILSNGFKLRTSAADANTNNATFVWAAFASNPFKTARAR